MDNTPTSTNAPTAAPVTPLPASNTATDGMTAATPKAGATTGSNSTGPSDAATGAAPIIDRLLKSASSSAHDAVASVTAKVGSLSDDLQGGGSDTRDEWIEAARDAIRQHPFAAVASAIVIGAALLSLNRSRTD
jgi:ElaB/YqjD/DUF883 family membrane-anchored ribosome-binding protein